MKFHGHVDLKICLNPFNFKFFYGWSLSSQLNDFVPKQSHAESANLWPIFSRVAYTLAASKEPKAKPGYVRAMACRKLWYYTHIYYAWHGWKKWGKKKEEKVTQKKKDGSGKWVSWINNALVIDNVTNRVMMGCSNNHVTYWCYRRIDLIQFVFPTVFEKW